MIQANIYIHTLFIGTAELLPGDESMGHIYGYLTPAEAYIDKIQPLIWSKETAPDAQFWKHLRINVQLENGLYLHPVGGCTIDDSAEFPHEPKRIDIAGVDYTVIDDFIKEERSAQFVYSPWRQININIKIALEDELAKEVGAYVNQEDNIITLKCSDHPLSEVECVALMKFGPDDDVLFSLRKSGLNHQYAVVHLTWSGKKESSGYPAVTFYNDFNDFVHLRMLPDHEDYS